MNWRHIHIEGQVQGVGFRPFVFTLAQRLGLNGWVRNEVNGIHIETGGTQEQLEKLLHLLQDCAPRVSRITKISSYEIASRDFQQFQIKESTDGGLPNLLITPDFGLCEDCRKEIEDPQNSRYRYPFTTCTHCGPRYSILKSLPYDRQTTSMAPFRMCSECEEEYHNPENRRFFSQTNSCSECSMLITLINSEGKKLAASWEDALLLLIRSLAQGEIIAIKGIGGYLLLTDATNRNAILTLRARKHRPLKPLALMYPNVEVLKQDAVLTAAEEKAFLSLESPVVLVNTKPHSPSKICTDLIAPGLDSIGVMQPYTAMFALLMNAWEKPLIATSGNISGSPILYNEEDALESLSGVADMFLIHNREIQIAQDDSVLRFSSINRKKIILRRSRGLAPTYLKPASSREPILTMGADLKSSFSLQANGRTYISQYLGDLESYQSQQSYRHAQDHLMKLLATTPERIIADSHPQYYSTAHGRALAKKWNIPLHTVQHHEAHAWSVLAENDLTKTDEPVLCVVWDGTGYGDDGNVWGGEFFSYEKYEMKRAAHVAYYPIWMGDRMAKEPRLSALFIASAISAPNEILKPKFSEQEWDYYTKLISTAPEHYSSSVGRLFDAVASMLGICDRNTFEGQAALYLESIATRGRTTAEYAVSWQNSTLSLNNLFASILSDIVDGQPPAITAYKFHAYLADAIYRLADDRGIHKIAFSGGVFQNGLLVDLIINRFQRDDCELFFHRELSPNDENISFGQLAFANSEKIFHRDKKQELVNNAT